MIHGLKQGVGFNWVDVVSEVKTQKASNIGGLMNQR
jgi:hypothetical protein